MAESIQRISKRRALEGYRPTSTDQIIVVPLFLLSGKMVALKVPDQTDRRQQLSESFSAPPL